MKYFTLLVFVLCALNLSSQEEKMEQNPPYHQIPDAPESFEAGNVAARMIDGLGYRYYWVSKDLRAEDLAYKPSEDGRTTMETLDHVYGLSKTIKNGPLKLPNTRTKEAEITWEEKRLATLENFKIAADILRGKGPKDMEEFEIIFNRGDKESRYPFWNMINGPIADAIYHCGQIVAFRRASGNPQDPGVSVFSGKTRE